MTDQVTLPPNAMRTPPRSGRSDWLQRWIDGEPPDTALLEQQGFHLGQYYAAAIYRPCQISGPQQLNSAQLAGLLVVEASRRNIIGPAAPHTKLSAVLFHPVEDPQQTARLKMKTEQIRVQLTARLSMEMICGVGRPARGLEALRQSIQEAEEAVRLSDELQLRTAFFGNSSLFNLLLSLKGSNDLQQFCLNWLGDLIAYDARQQCELLDTLRTYFANNGNTALTAKELRIHRNTLAYRLNRIAEITRLDLEDADVRLNLHLALKAREMLNANHNPQ